MCISSSLIREINRFFFQEFIISCYLWCLLLEQQHIAQLFFFPPASRCLEYAGACQYFVTGETETIPLGSDPPKSLNVRCMFQSFLSLHKEKLGAVSFPNCVLLNWGLGSSGECIVVQIVTFHLFAVAIRHLEYARFYQCSKRGDKEISLLSSAPNS